MMRTQAPTQEHPSPEATFSPTNLLRRMTGPSSGKVAPRGPRLDDNVTRELWESRITAPDPNADAEAKAALARLIRQIRSVKFEVKERLPTFSVGVALEPTDGPNGLEAAQDGTPEQIVRPLAETAAGPHGTLPEKVLTRLKHVVQDPNQVRDPLEMAELLFLSDRPAEAVILYQKALDLVDTNGTAAHEDRAWILLQIGNCLRETDMTRARDMYIKLIAEYPDSPWAELAKAHSRLITWYEQVRPRRLITGSAP